MHLQKQSPFYPNKLNVIGNGELNSKNSHTTFAHQQ